MRVVRNEQVIYFDVDDTLVLHDLEKYSDLPTVTFVDPVCGTTRTLAYHPAHVRVLTERLARGAHVKVMSAGGFAWAEAVVTALGLSHYSDEQLECSTKPSAMFDDLPIEQALIKTIYLNPHSKWKR